MGDRKLEKDAKGGGRSRGGKGGVYGCGESNDANVYARSLIRRLLTRGVKHHNRNYMSY